MISVLRGGSAVLLVTLTAGCAIGPPPESRPINNLGSAEATLDGVMERLEMHDLDAVKAVMTGKLIVDEEAEGGLLDDPPEVTSYRVLGSQPAIGPSGEALTRSSGVDLHVAWSTVDGEPRYDGAYDTWTFELCGDRWLLTRVLGRGNP